MATGSPRFPNYMQMRQPLPLWMWQVVQALSVAAAIAVIACLVVEPRTGLIVWWLYILPVLPLVFVLAPGIWRNACPMATLNQLPRVFGFSKNRSLPGWLRRHAYIVAVAFYVVFISLRAPLLDHNGPATAALLGAALVAAFVGGVLYKGKSGWCGTICPLLPIQKLYGQTPALVVPNAHCRPCVGCQKNCYDFNPRIATLADANDPDVDWVNFRRLFAGTFPGLVIAFFTVPDSVIGEPASMGVGLLSYYALVLAYMAASLGAFAVAEMFVPLSSAVLMAIWGAIGLNAHNYLRFDTAFAFAKPDWLFWSESALVLAVTVVFVYRTWSKEQVLGSMTDAPISVRPGATLERADQAVGSGHEVRFDDGGPTVTVTPGTTLLDVAERSNLAIEAGCRMGVCGADPIRITAGTDGLSPLTDDERATLGRLGLSDSCHRMACCARVKGPVTASLTLDRSAPAGVAAPTAAATGVDRGIERVVVIGNGIAGITAADHVRRNHPDCTIDVVADEMHPLYNRMGISRLVSGRSAMQGLHLLPDAWYADNRITAWLNTRAHAIDRERGRVRLATGEQLPYDRLILATGSAARLPPLEGIDRTGVFALRTADDAIGLRAHIQRLQARRALVIGGGLLGLEAAYAVHKAGLSVSVVQRGRHLMTGQLDEAGADQLAGYFRALGIEIVCGTPPAAVAGNGRVAGLVLADGRELDTDLVLVCAGIVPNVELALEAGLDIDRGIIVDDAMRTRDPAILAAGDCVEIAGAVQGLWPTAVEQAEVAAVNAVGGTARTYAPKLPVALLKGVGLHVLSLGVIEPAEGDHVIVDPGDGRSSDYRKLVLRDGHVVGGLLVGRQSEAAALTTAVRERIDVSAHLDQLHADLANLSAFVPE